MLLLESVPDLYSTTEVVPKFPLGAQFWALFAQLVAELGKAYWVAAYGYGTAEAELSMGLALSTLDRPRLATPTSMQDVPA